MKAKAKTLMRNNQNELLAARQLEVSLDRADNVIESAGLDATSLQPSHRTLTSACDSGVKSRLGRDGQCELLGVGWSVRSGCADRDDVA
jgi:hypothetical protein